MKTPTLPLVPATCILLAASSFAFSQNTRTPKEQGLVNWAKSRNYVDVEGGGSSSGANLALDVTDTWDAHRELYDTLGGMSPGMGQTLLHKAEDVAVAKSQKGDGELADATAHALNDMRLQWLAHALDQRDKFFRYSGMVDYLQRFEPYSLPQRLKSADLMLEASLLFKGYPTDMNLAFQKKWDSLTQQEQATAADVEKLAKRRQYLFNRQHALSRKKLGLEHDLTAELQAINAKLSKLGDWQRLMTPQTAYGLVPTLTELRTLIDEDTIVIDIVVARSLDQKPYSLAPEIKTAYIGSAFDREKSYGPYPLGDTKTVNRLAQTVIADLKADLGAAPDLMKHAAQLRDLVLGPMLAHAKGKKRIMISLDGELQFAPIQMLPDADGRFLIEDFEVSFFDSYRQLVDTSARRTLDVPTRSVLLGDPNYLSPALSARLGEKANPRMLNPLPGTRREIDLGSAVLSKQGKPSVVLLGDDANEPAFMKAMTQPAEIVHLSTHGCFFSPTKTLTDPLQRAALTLRNSEDFLRLKGISAKPDANDGLLQASEILGMDLTNTSLVILSACSTAEGEVIAGDLVLGFRGAFFVAGAANIVLTLVSVSDGICPALMTNFYTYLPSSRDQSEAWTRAIRGLLTDPQLDTREKDFHFLGPFVFVNNRPASAKDWPVGPVRGFINWRRPLAIHKYVEALGKSPEVDLYLTPAFRKRLRTIDSPVFGLVPSHARILSVEVQDDTEAYITLSSGDKNVVFIVIKKDGIWLIDDIIETIPDAGK